jgi:uncharacterized protein YcgI (DUF1989 family)
MLDEVAGAGAPRSGTVRQSQVLRITDVEGQQVVNFLCYNAADPQERYYVSLSVGVNGRLLWCALVTQGGHRAMSAMCQKRTLPRRLTLTPNGAGGLEFGRLVTNGTLTETTAKHGS